MPILKRRSPYVKVFRPNGTRFANGRGETVDAAILEAKLAFVREFHDLPMVEHAIFEVNGMSKYEAQVLPVKGVGAWMATLYDIRKDNL